MNRLSILLLILVITGCAANQGIQPYGNPYELHVNVHGTAPREMRFSFRVDYVAQSGGPGCETNNFLAGRQTANSKSYTYFPDKAADTYSISIPLKEIAPDTGCNWQVSAVNLCLAKATSSEPPHACGSLIFVSAARPDNLGDMTLKCKTDEAFPLCFPVERMGAATMSPAESRNVRVDMVQVNGSWLAPSRVPDPLR